MSGSAPFFLIPDIINAANSIRRVDRRHTHDNVGMDAGKQLAAEILDAIKSGRDLWVLDQFIEGYDRLERAKFSSGQNGLSFHWLPCWKRKACNVRQSTNVEFLAEALQFDGSEALKHASLTHNE